MLDSGRYILKRIHVATCVVGEAQWLLGLDAERHERRGDEPVALEYLGGGSMDEEPQFKLGAREFPKLRARLNEIGQIVKGGGYGERGRRVPPTERDRETKRETERQRESRAPSSPPS